MAKKIKVEEEEKKTKKVSKVKEKEEVIEKEEIESPIKTGMSDMMKGFIIGCVVTALIASLVFLLVLGSNDKNLSLKSPSGETTNQMELYRKYYKGSKPALIVYASSQCGYCALQEPIIKRIAEMYDFDYVFMDILALSESEYEELTTDLDVANNGTPTSIIVKDGKKIKEQEGMMEGKEYVEFLISGGVLPKGSTYVDEANLISVTYKEFEQLLKGKTSSVVLFDQYASCGQSCLDERAMLNGIAKENNIAAYYLSANEVNASEFIENVGKWGYSTEAYKESKAVSIPLLMIVKNGKIVWHQDGNMTEDDIRAELKNHGIIK